jgi:hypothetical protein
MMAIQKILENAIHKLVNEFAKAPYVFFTEADAVARFHQILEENPITSRRVQTGDGFEMSLIHREYPTFFRFSGKNPTERLGPPASRGHYDTVVLNPDFAMAHSAATVTNRDIKAMRERDKNIKPFEAVVEFKLDNVGWSAGRAKGAIAALDKLHLSDEAPLRYLVVLMRYSAPTLTRWEKYWPKVKQAAIGKPEIGSLFAIQWLTCKEGSEVYHFGRWLNNWPHRDSRVAA